MADFIVRFFASLGIHPGLSVMLIAAAPITELRAAIPVGISVFHLPVWETLAWALLGNIFIVPILIFGLAHVAEFFMKHVAWIDRLMKKLFAHTRTKHTHRFEKYGAIALVLWSAIPLPGAGAWSAVVGAYVFGIPPVKTFYLITIGTTIAGLIVTAISTGAVAIFT